MNNVMSNIPRIYTALAEWMVCIVFILNLNKRFGEKRLTLIIIGWFGLQCGLQYFAGQMQLYFWIPGMILSVGSMLLFILFCCDISLLVACFWCVQAFIIAEFTAAFEWQIHCYLVSQFSEHYGIVWNVILLVIIYSVVFICVYLLWKRYIDKMRFNITVKNLLTSVAIAVVVFTMSNISFFSINTPFSGRYGYEIFYIRTLVDFCGIILLLSQQEQLLWLKINRDLDAMQNIINRQYEQYCHSKENIETINLKYHDIKHQIALVKDEQNPDKKALYLEKLEDGINLLGYEVKTGNSVLDTLLTGKKQFCDMNGIDFICVADGTLLDIMDIMDICSIFGNALDNAIEGVMKINDKEKRLIRIAVFSHNNMVVLKFENCIDRLITLDGNDFISTKKDKTIHGYGIKSIRHTAEKYGGGISIDTQNGFFNLCIVIPKQSS